MVALERSFIPSYLPTIMMAAPRTTSTIPVARLSVAALALLANLAAMRAHRKVKSTQNPSHHRSGTPPIIIWLAAPVKAVNVIVNTLVPTAVFSS